MSEGREKRSSSRVASGFAVSWETAFEARVGTICDISEGGCFVLSASPVGSGQKILLKAVEPEAALSGQVVAVTPEIGFSVSFDSESRETAKRMVEALLERASGSKDVIQESL